MCFPKNRGIFSSRVDKDLKTIKKANKWPDLLLYGLEILERSEAWKAMKNTNLSKLRSRFNAISCHFDNFL